MSAIVDTARSVVQSIIAGAKSARQQRRGPSFTTLSLAQSLDGCMAERTGSRSHFSGHDALVMTHSLRSLHDGILVGVETVLTDDPLLTVRLAAGNSPVPIILDNHLRTPPSARLFETQARPWIVTRCCRTCDKAQALKAQGARFLQLYTAANDSAIPTLLARLKEVGIHSIMVEGGARVSESFMRSDCVDFMVLTIAPLIAGNAQSVHYRWAGAGHTLDLASLRQARLGRDLILFGPAQSIKRSDTPASLQRPEGSTTHAHG